jgi:hypothetical protein
MLREGAYKNMTHIARERRSQRDQQWVQVDSANHYTAEY